MTVHLHGFVAERLMSGGFARVLRCQVGMTWVCLCVLN